MSKIRKMWSVAMYLAAAFCLTACGSGDTRSETLLQAELMTSEQANYKTVQVEVGEYAKSVTGKATIVYLLETGLTWEKSNTRYRQVLVKAGQEVKEGDVLMVFDIDGSKVELESLKLQLLRAQEDTEAGKLDRLTGINEAKNKAEELESYDLQIANLKIEKLQAEYEEYMYQSERKIAQLAERIATIEREVKENTLLAPFDGVIDEVIRYNEGDLVVPGQVLITMYSTDKLLLQAGGSTDNLRYNMPITIETGSKDNVKSFSGRVVAAGNILPAKVSQSMTLIELDEKVTKDDLKGNLRYQCTVEEIQNILVVDRKAISKEDGKSFVNVLDGDMVQKRFVVTGTSNTEKVWILDGLSEGQKLIVD